MGDAGRDITAIQAGLLALSLTCCLVCLWMVFFFGRRLQTSAYLRDSLVYAAKSEEMRNRLRELDERKLLGPLDPNHLAPRGFHGPSIWQPSPPIARVPTVNYPAPAPLPPPASRFGRAVGAPPLSPEEQRQADEHYLKLQTEQREAAERAREQAQKDYERRLEEEEKRVEPFRVWEIEEKARYAKLRERAEAESQLAAERRVPKAIDISLLGGGWTFILEFSTVIVIIFVLLCLGILRSVSGQEIITILASIAGYVLGKAVAGNQKSADSKPGSQAGVADASS